MRIHPRAGRTGINRIQKAALDRSRLGIPILYGADATARPLAGARRDHLPAADRAGGYAQSGSRSPGGGGHRHAEPSAIGLRWVFGPLADVARDLRWGRYYETYSEDPAAGLVAGRRHGAAVFKAPTRSHPVVAATAKHFIGYSQPDGGKTRHPATHLRARRPHEVVRSALPGGDRRRRRLGHEPARLAERHAGRRVACAAHRSLAWHDALRGSGAFRLGRCRRTRLHVFGLTRPEATIRVAAATANDAVTHGDQRRASMSR